jgi:hypothetical protein
MPFNIPYPGITTDRTQSHPSRRQLLHINAIKIVPPGKLKSNIKPTNPRPAIPENKSEKKLFVELCTEGRPILGDLAALSLYP